MSAMTLDATLQYIKNCESLILARTEQLRDSSKANEVLLGALEAVTKAETLEDAIRIAQTAVHNRPKDTMENRKP